MSDELHRTRRRHTVIELGERRKNSRIIPAADKIGIIPLEERYELEALRFKSCLEKMQQLAEENRKQIIDYFS